MPVLLAVLIIPIKLIKPFHILCWTKAETRLHCSAVSDGNILCVVVSRSSQRCQTYQDESPDCEVKCSHQHIYINITYIWVSGKCHDFHIERSVSELRDISCEVWRCQDMFSILYRLRHGANNIFIAGQS